jgi:signal transduction histidine kinase
VAPEAAEEARQITQMATNAGEHARLLAKGLSPSTLLKEGMPAALETLARHTESLFRLPCRFENQTGSEAPLEIPPLDTACHFYRIAQEAANNAAKHSQGTQITLRLRQEPDALTLEVEDDGIGFKGPLQGSMGMQNMHTRTRFIGATLEILSAPNSGTRVVCRLPKKEQPLPGA